MNAPRDLGPDFRSWLDDVPPMPPGLPQHTVDEAGRTRQRRRWPGFTHRLKPTAGTQGWRDRAPSPAYTTTDHMGGTRSMFSATKLLAVAASVALFGALTLTVPTGQLPVAVAPGAEVPALDKMTSFTGELEVLGKDQIGTTAEFDWGFGRTGEQWTTRLTTTDPRYSGLTTGLHNNHQMASGGPYLAVHTSRMFTQEAGGTWLQAGYGYQDPETNQVTYVTQSSGEGVYDGLSAIDVCIQSEGADRMTCSGIVFEGEWPETPVEAPGAIPERYPDS